MRLTIRALGPELLDINLDTDEPPADDDYSRDLSGGNLGEYPIDPGPTGLHMGFTLGLEDE
jgi:hypothetical protein